MKNTLSVALVAAVLLYAPLGHCFGREGHRIVCEMAYQMLAPGTRVKVDRLMRAVPTEQMAAIKAYDQAPLDKAITFADGCVWPDAIKRQDEYAGTYAWHFINVQRDDVVVSLDDCVVGCLLSAIDHHFLLLKDDLADWPRAQALMFLGHWVADIHQPMHVSFGDDRGGNDSKVMVPTAGGRRSDGSGSCGNLHAIWDYCIIEQTGLTEVAIVTELLAEIKVPQREKWRSGPPRVWANESLALTRSPSLGYCAIAGSRCNPIASDSQKPRQLAADYYSANWPVLKQRMGQAAVRLSALLTRALE